MSTNLNESRTGIASDGTDFGGDTNNNGLFGLNDPGGDLVGRFGAGTDFFGYRDPDGDGLDTSGDFAFKNQGHTESGGVNLRIEQDITDTTLLTSVSDYKSYNKLLFIDVDAARSINWPILPESTPTASHRNSASAVPATPRDGWLASLPGIDSLSNNGLKAPANSIPALLGGFPFPAGADIGVQARLKTDSYSLFGQYEWDFAEDMTLIAGLRGIIEKKDYRMRQGFWFNQGNYSVNVGEPFVNIRSDFLGRTLLHRRPLRSAVGRQTAVELDPE